MSLTLLVLIVSEIYTITSFMRHTGSTLFFIAAYVLHSVEVSSKATSTEPVINIGDKKSPKGIFKASQF